MPHDNPDEVALCWNCNNALGTGENCPICGRFKNIKKDARKNRREYAIKKQLSRTLKTK